MFNILLIFLLCSIKTDISSCSKYYAIETDLSEEELDSFVHEHGGLVTGKVPFQNVYEVTSRDYSDSHWEQYGFYSRSKRSIETFETRIKSHPQIQNVKSLDILHIQKRIPFITNEFDKDSHKKLKQVKLPVEMRTKYDENYNQDYVQYADKIRRAINVNDPAAQFAWQYLNDGKGVSPLVGLDMNLYPVFLENITGRGANVVIIDDGLDTTHPDLKANYDETISANMDRPETNGLSPRGPRKIIPENDGHGTRCAGLAGAVANNSFCSHGVAPNTKLGGIRILTAPVTDILEARGLSYQAELINIYCSSWGPSDDGITMDLPHEYAEKALSHGIEKGRHGLGSIYVFASGNGGVFGDSCGADGFVSSPNVIAVSATDNIGQKTVYSEACAAVRVSVPVGGSPDELETNILPTTMENGKCMQTFIGTSAAAPMLSGCIALALEANPKLTWRDVAHLLPWSARIPNPADKGWTVNGAGLIHHPYFGFGTIDCYRMVYLAKQWNLVGPLCVLTYDSEIHNVPDKWASLQGAKQPNAKHLFQCDDNCISAIAQEYETQYTRSWPIRSKSETKILLNVTNLNGITQYSTPQNIPENTKCHVDIVEQVIIHVKWKHSCRGSLKFHLISPSGTDAMILDYRKLDTYSGESSMIFSSVVHWGEKVSGLWKLIVKDLGKCDTKHLSVGTINGFITGVTIKIRGTSENDSGFTRNNRLLTPLLTHVGTVAIQSHIGHQLTSQEIEETYNEQRISSLNLSISSYHNNA
ncbi:unnamed protein product [Heterobilharzia americana]|nr:unnamed protein product [Heterobilharzia americana]